MINNEDNPSEKLFSDLCAKQYLKGFVFHSPKYDDPTEKEAGDVVLWLRTFIIVFEIVWRNPSSSKNTKHFIKRIGEKRNQLESDFNAYAEKGEKIKLTNKSGQKIRYNKDYFHHDNYAGVIIVDCDSKLNNIHYKSYKKSLDLKFPIAIITKKDFLDLLNEIDTISDLLYYLKDRHKYLQLIYHDCPHIFINLNLRTERNIIALYKYGFNSFKKYSHIQLLSGDAWEKYTHEFKQKIEDRNIENKKTKIIDNIIELLSIYIENEIFLQCAWELGVTTRRERVALAGKLIKALSELENKKERRQFAYYNQTTGCWSVFYIQYGEDIGTLEDNTTEITQLKIFKEIKENDFKYSVFGYGFRKSSTHTNNTIDELFSCIEDADNYPEIPLTKYTDSLKYFGYLTTQKIHEFPIQ